LHFGRIEHGRTEDSQRMNRCLFNMSFTPSEADFAQQVLKKRAFAIHGEAAIQESISIEQSD
jgi:hypothetical protein